ncbi:MAG: hypothetical protein ACR2LN_01210 [Candidatus Levyibacteriota bacterium]
MNTNLKKFSVTLASVALLAVTSVGTSYAQGNQSNQNMNETYRVNLSPLNNSGVSGFATIHQTGDQYTVNMHVWGLEANQAHVQHIHGMTDGSNGSCPTMAQNTDNDATISLAEGLTTYGPILQPLTPFQTTGVNGTEMYHQTFTVNSSDPTMDVMPLGNREIVIHGMTVNANQDLSNPQAGYDATLPVACGHLIPMLGNGQGGSGETSVGISGNGANSRNNVNVESSNTTRVSQDNDTRVNNDVHSNVNTGNNHSSFNTGGATLLNSGDGMSRMSIFNGGGMNMFRH